MLFVHHRHSAAQNIIILKVFGILSRIIFANPTELITTDCTCHVIAAEVAHNLGFADRAKNDASILKLLFLVLLACDPLMLNLFTAAAHLGGTAPARVLFLVRVLEVDF
jgi:hypothetical protein